MNGFQESLQELLTDRGINRATLARAIGITPTTVNGYFNQGYYPELGIAIRIARYFGCSLDYLFGRSNDPNNDHANNTPFVEHLDRLLKESGIPIARAMREMKMGEYNYYRWKAGAFPKTVNLLEIANYFDVSLDTLAGDLISQ